MKKRTQSTSVPPQKRIPKLCLHKPTGQGYVRLNGRQVYLGVYGHPETHSAYERAIQEWKANGKQLPVAKHELTVMELIDLYVDHIEQYYRGPDGRQTSEVQNLKTALKPLKEMFGRIPAEEFGPKALKRIRQTWIDAKLCRGTCNRYTKGIRRCFSWGAEEELIPGATLEVLKAVKPLKAGRTEAVETNPVQPVSQADIKWAALLCAARVTFTNSFADWRNSPLKYEQKPEIHFFCMAVLRCNVIGQSKRLNSDCVRRGCSMSGNHVPNARGSSTVLLLPPARAIRQRCLHCVCVSPSEIELDPC